VTGAALNWYYYSAFAHVVVSRNIPEVRPWKLYERTKEYTVDDGALAGAALGLAVSVPSLFMRRPAIPRWTQCLGMTNFGACAGVLGAHAYLQYTGERQQAYKQFGRHVKRRSLEFWSIFWDAELMASLDPIMQQYVRHNSLWYTRWLPQEVFERAEQDVELGIGSSEPTTVPQAPIEQQPPFYITPVDYAEDLRRINVESTLASIEAMEADRRELLKDAEYLLHINARQKYEYCHMNISDKDERHNHLQQIHLVDVAYNRLRAAAHDINVKLTHWRMSMKHKAAWEAATTTPTETDSVADWLPKSQAISPATHKPTYSMVEIEKMHWQIAAEVKTFEHGYTDDRHPSDKRERWRKDAEDGRAILKAADCVLFRLQKAREVVDDGRRIVDAAKEEIQENESVKGSSIAPKAIDMAASKKLDMSAKEMEQSRVEGKEVGRPPVGALDKDESS
jgi:hypothetical protein